MVYRPVQSADLLKIYVACLIGQPKSDLQTGGPVGLLREAHMRALPRHACSRILDYIRLGLTIRLAAKLEARRTTCW